MEFKDRLKRARKKAGLTQAQLADLVGIKQASISEIERGITRQSGHVIKIAQVCGVEPIWLAHGTGAMTKAEMSLEQSLQPIGQGYPILEWSLLQEIAHGDRPWLRDDTGINSARPILPGEALGWMMGEYAGRGGFWLQVESSSMIAATSPSFVPGSYILVRSKEFELISGKFYIFLNKNGETTFKQYVLDAGSEYLMSLNPSFKTIEIGDDGWEAIGRVVDTKTLGL